MGCQKVRKNLDGTRPAAGMIAFMTFLSISSFTH